MPPFLASATPAAASPIPCDVRPPSGGKHHAVDHEGLVVGQFDAVAVLDLRDEVDRLPGDDLDAAAFHLRAQMLPDVVVEPAQDVVAAIDQRHLGAEPVEDAGELERDVAAALDENAPGQLREMKRLVRGDHVLEAGDLARRHRARRRWRSGWSWPAARSPVATRRTVWASSSTARLATILTSARSSADV